MQLTAVTVDPNIFPQELRPLLQGSTVYDSSCSSNARVLYCDKGCYIKIDAKGELAHEAAMTQQFHRMGIGPELMLHLSQEQDFMVTRAVPGKDLTHRLDDPERLCRILAQTLRALHDRPTADLPRSPRMQRYLDAANGNNEGYYDPSVLMSRFPIASRDEAWRIMQENKHRLRCDTLIHGDFCLPNVILDRDTTLIDLNLSGVGDRHIDLYWAIWSLQYNLKTDAYTDLFLEQYGTDCYDPEMLRTVAAFELYG